MTTHEQTNVRGNRKSAVGFYNRAIDRDARAPRKASRIPSLLILLVLALAVMGVYYAETIYFREIDKVINCATIEAGESASLDMYFKEAPEYPGYVNCNLDFKSVDTTIPQTIQFNICDLWTNIPCVLTIVDTTAPQGKGIPQKLFSTDEIPDVHECITGIEDLAAVSVSWNKLPDITPGGEFKAQALLVDSYGNKTFVDVPLIVTRDSMPPVITGTKDIEAFCGDTISYRDGVSVNDDYDKTPRLEIDTSKVDIDKPGTYKVKYRAYDFTGNMSKASIKVTLTKKPTTYVEPEKLDKAAQKILDKIIKPDMTDMEKALQITWWCRYNIHYVHRADTTSFNRAAYDAIVKRTATCYGYACAAKEMYRLAGIKNRLIKRREHLWSKHYWNYIQIDGKWYHCDSTPRSKYHSYFFMYTTNELKAFRHNGWGGYIFDESKYPKSAKKSVQNQIDYVHHKVKKK